MRKMGGLLAALNLMAASLNGEEVSDEWVNHWINGVEFSKDQNNYPKAIETYTTAIQKLSSDQIAVQLNLVLERGSLYFQTLDYSNAIKDFSIVLNNSQANQEQKIEALWGRSKAYLASGKVTEYEKDSHELEEMQFFFNPIADTKQYAILKVNPALIRDAKEKKVLYKSF